MSEALSEIIRKQEAIIHLQAGAISDLLRLLMQHITAEEADNLEAVKKINQAAAIREEIEGI